MWIHLFVLYKYKTLSNAYAKKKLISHYNMYNIALTLFLFEKWSCVFISDFLKKLVSLCQWSFFEKFWGKIHVMNKVTLSWADQ